MSLLSVDFLARQRVLADALVAIHAMAPSAELVGHWLQGEFHHDLVFRVPDGGLVISTNCNGGIKEVALFPEVPDRAALWHRRCPDNPEFAGACPAPLASARTEHWFDPCEVLAPDARSELRPEFRTRQRGGGWTRTKEE